MILLLQYNPIMEYLVHQPLAETYHRIHIANDFLCCMNPVSKQSTNYLLTPGFCDLQVNGGFGVDLNTPNLTVEDVISLNQHLLRIGVTTWCPTLITASHEQICRNLAVIHQACLADELTELCVAGIHLEGPYLSEQEGARGAHPLEWVRKPDLEEFEFFQNAAGGRVKIVTIAPELEGALEFIETLSREGVALAIGHSLATQQQISSAVRAGAKLSTHLGNGLPAQVNRHDNPFINMLVQDELFASVIFDGHHLPRQVRQLTERTKGKERLLMVSDSTRLTGMPPGMYDEPIGGKVVLSTEGRLSLAGTPYLAGAAMSLLDDVNRMLQDDTFSLVDLLKMSMTQPRDFLKVKQDSFVLFEHHPKINQLEVVMTSVNHKVVYHKKENLNV